MPAPSTPPGGDPAEGLRLLGEALLARAEDVLSGTVARTIDSGEVVDAQVQERFERICQGSTTAVARWIAGESIDVAIEAGRESWEIFGELAVHRAASLDEVTRRYFWWRDAMAEVLRACASRLEVGPEALAAAEQLGAFLEVRDQLGVILQQRG